MTTRSLLIASDLDGTLLDHETYSFTPALPALKIIKQRDIPLVFVTSKTEAEVVALRNELENNHPFIVENGGATIVPDGYFNLEGDVEILGRPREEILMFLGEQRRTGQQFRSFHDLGTEEIARLTGLPFDDAERANDRAASEPLVWDDSATSKTRFIEAAQHSGFNVLQGGRFLTIGGQTDKGSALKKLIARYDQAGKKIERIIALGDSGNDVALLSVADIPIWVRKSEPNPDTEFMSKARSTIQRGPSGWNDVVIDLLCGKDG